MGETNHTVETRGCPICGLQPEWIFRSAKHDKRGRMWLSSWRLVCHRSTGHIVETTRAATKAEAIDQWNRRA